MPLPFALDHINLWLLEDGRRLDGDRYRHRQRADARAVGADLREERTVKRVIVTHYHPDHAGNAAWLCERYGVELWMTQGEYLTAHAVRNVERRLHHRRRALGVPQATASTSSARAGMARARQPLRGAGAGVSALVPAHHRGRRDRASAGTSWRAMIGHGHAPEHLSLYCEGAQHADRGRHAALHASRPTSASGRSIPRAIRCACSSIRSRATASCPPTCWCCRRTASRFAARTTRVAQLEQHHQERLARAGAVAANSRKAQRELLERAVPPPARRAPDLLRDGRGDSPPALPVLRRAREARAVAMMASCAMQQAESERSRRAGEGLPAGRRALLQDPRRVRRRSRPQSMSSAVRDEMGIAKAFMDLYARMAADPAMLAEHLDQPVARLHAALAVELDEDDGHGERAGRRAGQGRLALQGRGLVEELPVRPTSSSPT